MGGLHRVNGRLDPDSPPSGIPRDSARAGRGGQGFRWGVAFGALIALLVGFGLASWLFAGDEQEATSLTVRTDTSIAAGSISPATPAAAVSGQEGSAGEERSGVGHETGVADEAANAGNGDADSVLEVTDTLITASSALPQTYEADWSSGLAGWMGSGSWVATGGVLMNDGKSGDSAGTSPLLCPYAPPAADYAVEAEIQLVRYSDEGAWTGADGFGLVLRRGTEAGLRVGHYVSVGLLAFGSQATGDPNGAHYGVYASNAPAGQSFSGGVIADQYFRPGAGWHLYRVEARANHYTLTVDGTQLLDFLDNSCLKAGRVGLWCDRCQVSVRSFRVDAL